MRAVRELVSLVWDLTLLTVLYWPASFVIWLVICAQRIGRAGK